MIILIQRVSQASVVIEGQLYSEIGAGMLALVCFEPEDTEAIIDRQIARLLNYRIFSDQQGKMNLSLKDTHGGLMLVPQFTLGADTRKGNRPSFSSVAPPELGQRLFLYTLKKAKELHAHVGSGVFGADMSVGLINDGPVTFWLRS